MFFCVHLQGYHIYSRYPENQPSRMKVEMQRTHTPTDIANS